MHLLQISDTHLNLILWGLQMSCALVFLVTGGLKVVGNKSMVYMFDMIGLGQWYRYLTGAIELVGSALIMTTTISGFGALLLVCVVIGAIIIHSFILQDSPVGPILLLLILLIVAWGRRGQIAF
ncbi:MAG: DoxX family protein [Acidobacteriaceae bacterium]